MKQLINNPIAIMHRIILENQIFLELTLNLHSQFQVFISCALGALFPLILYTLNRPSPGSPAISKLSSNSKEFQ